MTFAGVLLGVAIGIVLLSWVMNLIGRDRLYVGYGVIFKGCRVCDSCSPSAHVQRRSAQ